MKVVDLNMARNRSTNADIDLRTENKSAKIFKEEKHPNSQVAKVVNLFKVGTRKVDKTELLLREHGYLPKREVDEIENVQLTNDLNNKVKYLEFSTFFFAWAGMSVGIVEYELRYNLGIDNAIDEFKES